MVLEFVSVLPLIIIVLGVVGNTISFLIFTLNKEMNKYSSMVFLAFIAVCDTIGLFEWNLNHFLKPVFGIQVDYLSVASCKIAAFIQYASLQSSGLLYSIICVDRYFTVTSLPGSFRSKLPFGTRKTAFIWSICIITIVCLLNLHLLIFIGYETTTFVNKTSILPNGSIAVTQQKNVKLVCYATKYYKLLPMWDIVQVVMYSIIPFLIMAIFNLLLIINLLIKIKQLKRMGNIEKDNKTLKLSVSLICVTFSFIVMTTPGTLSFAFFYNQIKSINFGTFILTALDSIMFLQQGMIIWISFLTNQTFAEIIKNFVKKLFCGVILRRNKSISTNKEQTTFGRNVAKSFSSIFKRN